ncbi:MAG: hypothetical protein JXK95_04730, partial [Bacteroidales bacterium]|nr:hypothetical protein [Bacteroidales bacterium]
GLVDTKQQPMFYADDDDTDAAARIAAGDIVITSVKFLDLKAGQTQAFTGITFTENAAATGAGNGIGKPDWLPDALNTVKAGTKVIE